MCTISEKSISLFLKKLYSLADFYMFLNFSFIQDGITTETESS